MNGLKKPFFPVEFCMSMLMIRSLLIRMIPFGSPGFEIEDETDESSQSTADAQRHQQDEQQRAVHDLPCFFRPAVIMLQQPLQDLIPLIALYQDKSVLDRAAGAAMGF